MLNLNKGFYVPQAERLDESYELQENSICANVSADKIFDLITGFIATRNEPLFFILELPVAVTEEQKFELRPHVLANTHHDVYFIDGLTVEEALIIVIRYRDLLFEDGMISWGIGCHESQTEIMRRSYNLVTLYSQTITDCEFLFEKLAIPQVEKLITAYDLFTTKEPGEKTSISFSGKTVYDLPEMLKDFGIYLAQQNVPDRDRSHLSKHKKQLPRSSSE